MTVQDAEPADEQWLQHLLDGFDDDQVAGVCGQQIVPHDTDKNPIDWFRPLSPPDSKKYSFPSAAQFDALDADEKRGLCRWDNVTAMYRRDVLLQIPFQRTSFAEDALWARDALRAGYAIVYNTAARVKHYHFEDPDYTFRRCFAVFYHMYKFFEVRPTAGGKEWMTVLKNMKTLVKSRKISWPAKWRWLKFNHNQRKAIRDSVHTFDAAIASETLEKKYGEICGTPPQALKPVLENGRSATKPS